MSIQRNENDKKEKNLKSQLSGNKEIDKATQNKSKVKIKTPNITGKPVAENLAEEIQSYKNISDDVHFKRVILLYLYTDWKTYGHQKNWQGIDPYSLIRKYDSHSKLGLKDVVRNLTDLIERGYVREDGNPENQDRIGIPWEFVRLTSEGRKLVEIDIDSEFPAKWVDFALGTIIKH